MSKFGEYWKQSRIQKPEGSVHTERWDRCVQHVKGTSSGADPYAVCTAMLGDESFKAMDEEAFNGLIDTALEKIGIVAGGPIPESLLARQDLGSSQTNFSKAAGAAMEWITVRGRHIPIKEGENARDAVREAFGGDGADKPRAPSKGAKIAEDHIESTKQILENAEPEHIKQLGGEKALMARLQTNVVDGMRAQAKAEKDNDLSVLATYVEEKLNPADFPTIDGFIKKLRDVVGSTKSKSQGSSSYLGLISRIKNNQRQAVSKSSSFKDAWSRVKPR